VFNQFLSNSQLDEQNKIAAGSRLYPIESLLRNAINDAGLGLETIRQAGDLIEYHNHLTGYLYTMILAGTGTRPISDLIESIGQFDFECGYFYIDDKSSSRGKKGRLVALPDRLLYFICKDYLLHLRVIAHAIGIEKSPLASEIDRIAKGLHSDRMPFLFFLNNNDGEVLDWESVSASRVSSLDLFDWPLPANLFRHRLAKLLPAEGVHQEIVDGFLGHVESGLETYGDFSTRSFLADSKKLRPVLNKLFDQLGFMFPKHQPYLKLKDSMNVSHALKGRVFGSVSRARERRARIVNAIKAAKWEMGKALGDMTLDALDENGVEALSKVMLFHANGLPRNDGFLRYAYLLKCINRYSKETGRRVKLKKQYVFAESTTPFSALSVHAGARYVQLFDALSSLLATVPASRFSKTDSALLNALIFSLENRVSDRDLLIKAAMGTYYRIVRLQEQYYVEFSVTEKIESLLICAKRFPITRLCAYWMQNASHLAISEKYLDKPVSATFQAIISLVSENNGQMHHIGNIRQLIRALSEILNQANVQELPGILAGYLSGRVSSYSWGWPEFIRFQLGQSYRFDFARCLSDSPDSELILPTAYLPVAETTVNLMHHEAFQQSARALYRKVREALAREKVNDAVKTKTREGLFKEINSLLNQYAASVSQSCLLLVLWVKSLLYTKYSGSRYYAISSIERYFSALSTKFEVLAYKSNLVDMDGEDITELYSNMVDLAKAQDRAYVGRRLVSFHKWARGQGIEEPDWSEIDIPELEELVSPGFIFGEDYQNVLQLLTQSSSQYDIHDRYSGLLLLLTYRFGLRAKEALGLLASDLIVQDTMIVVSVSDNRFRKLKSLASRRQVPLLFELSACEKSIINWCLNYRSSIPGAGHNTPLFNQEGDSLSELIQGKIRRNVISVLKQVTGNGNTTIHHARHTAANKIAHALFPVGSLYLIKEFRLIDPSAAHMLLGTVAHTRREVWASARYLGHATRSTQLRNYIHFIGDWSAQYAKSIQLDKRFEVEGALDIGQFVVQAGELDFRLSDKNQLNRVKKQVTLVDLMQLFRLLANGKQIESSALSLGIPVETAHFAYNLLKAVSLKSDRVDAKDGDLGIFQKISPAVWKRLFEYIKSLNVDDPLRFDRRDTDLDIERLLPMFGSRGHVLMRTEFQFGIMQAFIEAFNVHEQSFDVLAPKNADQKLISRAEKYNFSPIVIGSDTEKGRAYKGYQLDAYSDSLEGENFLQRCGVVFKQENTGYARNSNNWILLVIIFITYLRSSRV
jgi:integrase